MPVENLVDNPEPKNPKASIWRYIEFWKLEDLVRGLSLIREFKDPLVFSIFRLKYGFNFWGYFIPITIFINSHTAKATITSIFL
jgi:hypothetical protein